MPALHRVTRPTSAPGVRHRFVQRLARMNVMDALQLDLSGSLLDSSVPETMPVPAVTLGRRSENLLDR